MLHTAWHIKIIEGLSCDLLYNFPVFFFFISDKDVYKRQGLMCAISGIILAARLGSVSPLAGDGNEMYAIAACVVGGIYLTGGRGKISGAFIGSVIVGLLTNIFNMQSLLSTFWESVITGSLVLIVVLLQQISARRAEHNRKIYEMQ